MRELGVDVFYSVKTNPERVILSELHSLRTSFSVSDPEEFLLAIAVGAKPEDVLYYERGLTKERARWLSASGCRNFAVDSRAAFENLLTEAAKGSAILIRIKAEGGSGKYSGGFVPGVDLKGAEELFEQCKKAGFKAGFLHHSSSQMEDEKSWEEKFNLLSKLPEADIVDIGGGMPIAYGDEDYSGVLKTISKGIKKIKAKKVIIEPGRFIVGPACSLVAKVELIDRENAVLNCSVYNVHIDTIIADLILPCRALVSTGPIKAYRLLGSSLCNLDVFDHNAKLPAIGPGDFVVFDNAGAYNFSSDFGSGSGITTYIVD